LQDDPSVKDALTAFRRSTKATALLGPSKNLQKVRDTITEAKRAYAPEAAAPKKKTLPPNTPPDGRTEEKGAGGEALKERPRYGEGASEQYGGFRVSTENVQLTK
jgi:hypothetical protein